MVRTLKPKELDQLLRAQRTAKVGYGLTLLGVIALVALLIKIDVTLPIVPCMGLGLGIGALVSMPYRREVQRLGLTVHDAGAILLAERERRTGLAGLPPETRARRDVRTSRICLGLGLLTVAALVVAASYFFAHANQPAEEDAPTDVWFAVSVFGGFAALIIAPALLAMAAHYRRGAHAWHGAAEQGR